MNESNELDLEPGEPILARGILDSKRDDLAVVMFHDGEGRFLTHVRLADLLPADLLTELEATVADLRESIKMRDEIIAALQLKVGGKWEEPVPPSPTQNHSTTPSYTA